MIRSAFGKVAWVGRTASMVFGLALVMALVLGVTSMALGANGDFFKVGKKNVASAVSTLDKSGAGPALRLLVDSGAPLAVNSTTKVASLNADRIDNREAASFANGVGGVATNADKLDSLDSADLQRRVSGQCAEGSSIRSIGADGTTLACETDDDLSGDTAGGALTGSYPNPQIAAGAVGATELATLPAVHAHGSQQIPNSTFTLHQFPNEHFDQVGAGQSGEMHSTTTNNSRLIAPRDGIYQIHALVGWGTNITGVRAAALTKNANGGCSFNRVAFDRVNATSEGPAYNHLGTLLALNQGDYVEVCVQQTSGGSMDTAGGALTFATMHYVSPK